MHANFLESVWKKKNMGIADSMSEYNGEPLNPKTNKHKYRLNGFSTWEA